MILVLYRLIVALLIIAFIGYETSYALLRYHEWAIWMRTLPFIGDWYYLLAPGVILMNGAIIVFLCARHRLGFQLALWSSVLCITYLSTVLLMTDYFFTPFHSYWNGMTWFHRMLAWLCMGWLSWIAAQWQPVTQTHKHIGPVHPAPGPTLQEQGES